MDRTEAIKSSIKKWHPGIWDEMEEALEVSGMNPDSISDRYYVFRSRMWDLCGFCTYFSPQFELRCDCPLHPDHCTSNLSECCSSRNVMGLIVKAWEEKAVNMFHFQRRKLVKFMASQLIEDDCECDMCDGMGVVNHDQ